MPTSVNKYVFKKGEILHLDSIYSISGLGSSYWWEQVNDSNSVGAVVDEDKATHASGETIRILYDIEITVSVKTK